MYLSIIFLPFFSILVFLIFARLFSKNFIIFALLSSMFFCIPISAIIYYEVIYLGFSCDVVILNWFHIYFLNINFHFFFDPLSVSMMFLIIFISFFVQLFSVDYMWFDPSILRFLIYINIFTFFMLIMVLSGNLVQFFLGWEGIGLSSYLLINFWYNRPEANRSAIKAIVLNKFGDFALYVSIIFIFVFFKTLDFSTLFLLVKSDTSSFYFDIFGFKTYKLDFICFFLFLACIGKSAQLGLHVWLPDAMEGPTPVSALLHSATMVTAGIFLILRFSHFFERSPTVLNFMLLMALFTILFSSFIAMGQYDIKKIIAYSTTSQLGYMLLSCGSSNYLFAAQHLFDHAFFKAVLFLAAGSMIHLNLGNQDIRQFGGVFKFAPITYFTFLISTLSLLGFSGTSGYYSKESIIESILLRTNFDEFVFLLTSLSVSFSVYYSFHLIYLTFYGTSFSYIFRFDKDISIFTNISLIVLSFVGLLGGYFFFDVYTSYFSFFQNSLYNNISNYDFIENTDDLGWFLVINLPFYFTLFGVIIFMFFQEKVSNFFVLNKNIFMLIKHFLYIFNRKWYFDLLLLIMVVSIFFYSAYLSFFKFIDRGIFEIFGFSFVFKLFSKISYFVNSFQVGYFYFNIFVLIFFFIFLLYFVFYYFLGIFMNFVLCLFFVFLYNIIKYV